jgi:Fe-S cluster assembly protein SufD
VPHRTAQALLVLAFLAESIQEIADEDIAEDIRERLERWLARHGSKG